MIWALLIVFILLAVLVTTPIIIRAKINKHLEKINGYTGKVNRISLQVFKGRIIVENTIINTLDESSTERPLLHVPVVEIHFKWKALFRKTLDLNLNIQQPRLYLLFQTPSAPNDSFHSVNNPTSLRTTIENLIPFHLDAKIVGGEVHCVTHSDTLEWGVTIRRFDMTVRNFSNEFPPGNVCHVRGTANLYDGIIEFNAALRPMERDLTLGLNIELKSINLVFLNELFKTSAKVDINTGIANLFTEVIVSEKSFKGYIKLLINDLEFIGVADRRDSIVQKIWERIVAGMFWLISQNKTKRLSMIIPIEGRLNDPDAPLGAALSKMVQKAIIKELTPSLRDVVDIRSLWHKARSGTKSLIGNLKAHRIL